jgi:hypothetical protein
MRMVIELQGIALTLIARRRPLRYYERQWPLDDQGNGGKRDGLRDARDARKRVTGDWTFLTAERCNLRSPMRQRWESWWQ